MSSHRRTKIIVTLGPATDKPGVLQKLRGYLRLT